MCYKIQKNIFLVHIRVLWSSFPLHWKPNILLVNYDSWWQHQMSVRELRLNRPSGRFSKSRGLSASVSFLSFPTATPSPLFHLRHFSRGLWLPFLVLCSLTARKRLLRRLGPVSTRMQLFSPKFKSTANFSAPAHEGNLFLLSGRSARKEIHNFPIKSSHLCRTSRHVWLSSSACDHCCAYQLICIMTISTYTTGARAEMTRQLGSCTVRKSECLHPSCKC